MLLNHVDGGCHAVLWLILLSGEAIKWATLSTEELRLFSAAQLMLTTGLACLVVITMILRKSHVDHFLQVDLLEFNDVQACLARLIDWHMSIQCWT